VVDAQVAPQVTRPGEPSAVARSESCSACPYRRDVPSGVWAPSEYDKLAAYDRPTGEQPIGRFHCHASPGLICHGWAVVEGRKSGPDANLALRVFPLGGLAPVEGAPLFASGTEAARHGKAHVNAPSPEAQATTDRLLRKFDHLKPGRPAEGWPELEPEVEP
jgi:hypothetical protein